MDLPRIFAFIRLGRIYQGADHLWHPFFLASLSIFIYLHLNTSWNFVLRLDSLRRFGSASVGMGIYVIYLRWAFYWTGSLSPPTWIELFLLVGGFTAVLGIGSLLEQLPVWVRYVTFTLLLIGGFLVGYFLQPFQASLI